MTEIKISVIIPVYNADKTLRRCLQSVQKQTLRDIEIICIDDGSTDDSRKLLEQMAAGDGRIHYYSQRNSGAGVARNNGIRHASGKFVSFLDSDDQYATGRSLEKLYQTATENHVKICGGNTRDIKNGKRMPAAQYGGRKSWFTKNGLIQFQDYQWCYGFCQYIYDRRMLIDNEIYFPPYRSFEDPPFLLNAMICAGEFYAVTDVILQVYRGQRKWNEQSLTGLLIGIREIFYLSKKHRLLFVQLDTAEKLLSREGGFRKTLISGLNSHCKEARLVMESTGQYLMNDVIKKYNIQNGNLYGDVIRQIYGFHWRHFFNTAKWRMKTICARFTRTAAKYCGTILHKAWR